MIDDSQAACAAIVARARSSLPFAFRFLPQDQRRAMTALYAWMRVTDDIADDGGSRDDLERWRAMLTTGGHVILPALQQAIERFQIPIQYFLDVIDGVASDLEPVHYQTFEELYPYCYRVASAAGLACLPIWGVTNPAAKAPAEAAGTAFQLTNILRDIGEDARNGRVYLPTDDLERFGSVPFRDGPAFRQLMRFEIERARSYYQQCDGLIAFLPRPGRRMFSAMRGVYEALLGEIARHPEAVLKRRIRVRKLRKAWIFLHALRQ